MKFRNQQGMTLTEILIAALVFTLALAALLSSISYVLYLIDISKDETMANCDLKNMMERIKVTPFADTLSLFPNGVVDGPVSNSYQTAIGGYSLNGEHISVTYANVNSDPLEIKADLTWQDKHNRSHSVSLSTFKAR